MGINLLFSYLPWENHTGKVINMACVSHCPSYTMYNVHYANGDRNSKSTVSPVLQGTVRMGKLVESQYNTKPYCYWYHPVCFQKAGELDTSDVAVNHIQGFEELKPVDQESLIEVFGNRTTVSG